jgi:acylphosphatase
MDKGLHCFVTGRVQGVYFRASTQKQASLYGLTGWVKNQQDGRVEVLAFGSELQLADFKFWLKSGPAMANVTGVDYETIEYQKIRDFIII